MDGDFQVYDKKVKGRHDFTIGAKKNVKKNSKTIITWMWLAQVQKNDQNQKYFSSCLLSSAVKKSPSDHLVLVRLPLGFFIVRDSIFIDSCLVHRIQPRGMVQRGWINTSVCFWWACGVRVCTISGKGKWGRPRRLWSRPVCVTSAWWWWRRRRRRWRC